MQSKEFINNFTSDRVFLARSTVCPKFWKYDHVGFLLPDGRQIQMSGHKDNDVYITASVTDDPVFSKQELKIIKLPKQISIPSTNIFDNVQNCSGFVAAVCASNGLAKYTADYWHRIFKIGFV